LIHFGLLNKRGSGRKRGNATRNMLKIRWRGGLTGYNIEQRLKLEPNARLSEHQKKTHIKREHQEKGGGREDQLTVLEKLKVRKEQKKSNYPIETTNESRFRG